jgi:hypothetical protein
MYCFEMNGESFKSEGQSLNTRSVLFGNYPFSKLNRGCGDDSFVEFDLLNF